MGGRPSKPVNLLQFEGKSHRTKDELKSREQAEQSTITGIPMTMSFAKKDHRIAAKEFTRIKGLLATIGKDDALYSNTINTYSMLVEECITIQNMREEFVKSLEDFEERCNEESLEYSEIIKTKIKMQDQILSCDKQLMNKRKMIFDISKENIMTIQSALRSVPKKEPKKEKTGMAAFRERRSGSG